MRGIIPARAGFPPPPASAPRPWSDHPRSRGVYALTFALLAMASGSSPLARGLPDLVQVPCFQGGIIPARAGFTLPAASASLSYPDHPRSRGVYPPGPRRCRARRGSSPLARGLRRNRDLAHGVLRIIPARAGFTHTIERKETTNADHPRSRGVYPTPKGKLQ